MKTLIQNNTKLISKMNNEFTNKEISKSFLNKIKTDKCSLITFLCFITMLFFASSCSRNQSSGCGTWPMSNARNNKVFNKSTIRPAYKNESRQYANYKKY